MMRSPAGRTGEKRVLAAEPSSPQSSVARRRIGSKSKSVPAPGPAAARPVPSADSLEKMNAWLWEPQDSIKSRFPGMSGLRLLNQINKFYRSFRVESSKFQATGRRKTRETRGSSTIVSRWETLAWSGDRAG